MKITEILEELRLNFKTQEDYYENELSEILNKYKCEKVKENLYVNKHRWYETSVIVYKVETEEGVRFFGIRACTYLFDELSSHKDIMSEYKYFEMIEKQEITYINK